MPYSLVLERASGTHNYSVQRKVEPTHLRVLCSVPVSQAHSNKFRLAALEALCFISLWCLGAQRKGMVIIMKKSAKLLRETIPGSVLEEMPGYYHGDFSLNHPQEFSYKLLDWISDRTQ